MNAKTDALRFPDEPGRTRPSSLWPFILLGWGLVGTFALLVAWRGGIRSDVRSFQIAYVIGFAGYILLLGLILRVRVAARLGRWRWWVIGCLVIRGLLLGTEPSDDTYRYVWEGRIQHAGFNPFAHSPDDPKLAPMRNKDWSKINHPDYPAIYPPVAQAVFLLSAAVSSSVYTVKLIHVLADAATILVLASCLRLLGRPPHGAMAYGLCPLVLSAFAVEGHLDSLMLLLAALSVRALLNQRAAQAGVWLGLAIASKLVLVVLLPWFVVRNRRVAIIAGGVLLATYLPYMGAGWALFGSLFRFGGSKEFFSLPATIGFTPYETSTARGIGAVLLLVFLLVSAWRVRRITEYAVSAMGALLMVMPIVHYWYFSWVMGFLPLGLRLRWVAASLAMVVYFEAALARSTTGVWSMPTWAPKAVWIALAIGWVAEAVVKQWSKRPVSASHASPSETDAPS